MSESAVLEEGDVFFLFQPTLDVEHPHELSEVARLLVVLRPRGGKSLRLMVVGSKRLPTGGDNDRNWGFVEAIADTGASLGCDRFNIEHFNPDEERIQTLVALVEAGYVDRIHLGHDAATFHDFMVGNPLFADEHPDYLHLSTRILPRLLAAGVTQRQIDEMLVENPRRFFA